MDDEDVKELREEMQAAGEEAVHCGGKAEGWTECARIIAVMAGTAFTEGRDYDARLYRQLADTLLEHPRLRQLEAAHKSALEHKDEVKTQLVEAGALTQ